MSSKSNVLGKDKELSNPPEYAPDLFANIFGVYFSTSVHIQYFHEVVGTARKNPLTV